MPRKINIGTRINKLFNLREKIRQKKAEIKTLETEFKALKEGVILSISDTGSDTSRTSLAVATVMPKVICSIDDWDQFTPWVYEAQALHVMYRRVNNATLLEIEETDGNLPPGVAKFEYEDLSLVMRSK